MTTIGIEYTSAIQQSAGIGRYTREMVKALAGLDKTNTYRLFVADAGKNSALQPPGTNFTCCPTRLSERWLARLWYRLRLPLWIQIWTGPIDLFHAPDFVLPPVKPDIPTIVTIHDLSFEHEPDIVMPGMEAHLKKWVPNSVHRADHVIAVSEATRQDLIHLYRAQPEKITTLHHGVTPEFRPITDSTALNTVRQKYGLTNGPFVLSISTIHPRKNYKRLIQAFARLDHSLSLVIGGSLGWHYEELFAEVTRLGLEKRVLFPGFIADTDLPALYSAADLFVFPSLCEGFGLGPLEAMACGTPVVTSNASSLPEVVGEAGVLVDPYDVGAIAEAMSTVWQDSRLYRHLSQAGHEQARKFTWEKMAHRLLSLYQTLLEE